MVSTDYLALARDFVGQGKDPRRLGRASGARTPLNPRQLNKNFALPGVQQDAVERLDAALRPHLQG